MALADPKNAVIRRQIEGIQFGFYTDEDVRARSVLEISSHQAFDAMGTPLPRGLYDPRLGPFDRFGPPCVTCGCLYRTCPGHAARIELCVPVYHPILFPLVVKILRTKCLNCHRFRIDKIPMEIIKTKFILLQQGRLREALELDQEVSRVKDPQQKQVSKRSGKGGNSSKATSILAIEQWLRDKQEPLPFSSDQIHHETSYERRLKRELIKEFISHCVGAKKCSHCGAFSPKIRQDSHNKIFQAPLSDTALRINTAEGIQIKSALSASEDNQSGADGYESDDPDHNPSHSDAVITSQTPDDKSVSKKKDQFMHALEVEAQVQRTWVKEPELCCFVFGNGAQAQRAKDDGGWRVFFMRTIPVTPSRFRPPMMMGTLSVEHAQNADLNKMLILNDRIRTLMAEASSGLQSIEQTERSQAQALSIWINLQTVLNIYMDSSKDPSAGGGQTNGIRQILEKKEGVFRKHMMGKRVDYACRSVISPDPYVGTNEIGIPLHFAKTLTYPTPVSDLNIAEMRKLVVRGPKQYPGASWVEFPDGRRVELARMERKKREGIAARLLAILKKGGRPVMVGRQLRNGDMMLVNRQPTLHKPGIMAHHVRVLHSPTQKTIRMHYANCNTYNADFDGDEMNCHFPQNDVASAESRYIAATDLQYIVPTDGSPLRGLIQDHVDSGVKMTCKNTFFEKWEYQQLMFAALASLPGLEVIRADADIEMVPPAILKPRQLWTGKQVITTLLRHVSKGNDRDEGGARSDNLPNISVEGKSKVPETMFGASEMEHLVLIRDGELLRGVLDKAAFGHSDFSMVHAVYEAQGPSKAGLLLNALGRLFTAHLQYYSGHSCRMEDLVLTAETNEKRRKLVHRAYNLGSRAAKAWADSEGGKVQIEFVADKPGADEPLKPVEAASAAAKIGQLLSGNEGKANFAALDAYCMSQLNPLASEIIKTCLPNGLAVPFPTNTFSLMVNTGAKGSTVNQSQVSCALGQQALEGRRVPRLSSGRTLPSFAPYDPSPRADGFITDRFLTGIRPQEYYFHCMAGREGLVDTAVKTSRSGYLQRCLVKHLEELKVCYDSTVRNGEGGVIQFLYGEDGLDPTKAAFLDCTPRTLEYLARNHEALERRGSSLPGASINVAAADARRYKEIQNSTGEVPIEVGSFVQARRLRVGSRWVRGTLCRGWFDAIVTKCNSDGTYDLKYNKDSREVKNIPLSVDLGRCGGDRTRAISSTCTLIRAAVPDPILSGASRGNVVHRAGSSGLCVSEKVAAAAYDACRNNEAVQQAMESHGISKKAFGNLVAAKYGSALCAPGEAVGCIAAQSIGEPSTQMTLNTFHLAGSGANVTLGIPRLREIIMMASKQLKTPTMSIPLDDSVSEKEALRLTRYFSKLTLNELIASHNGIIVSETLFQGDGGNWERAYHITLRFHPAERIKEAFGLNLDAIAQVVAKTFKPKIAELMKRELRRAAGDGDVGSISVQGGSASNFVASEGGESGKKNRSGANDRDDLEEDDDDDEIEDAVGQEDGVTAARFGRKDESESYGDMDDDDRAVANAEAEEEGRLFVDEDEDDEGDEDDGQSNDEDMRTDEEILSAFTNLSDQPKLDYNLNAIHIPALRVDPAARPLLMVGLVERAASATLVRARPKIEEAYINEEDGRGRCLQTAGANFQEFWKLENVDYKRLASNDIWAMCCAYGVEAARSNIVEQIRSVFGVYGISVDPRHLSLISDYMTFDGGFTPMNRIGLADISSPFLQMSFETTAVFMTQAALHCRKEPIMSPSANIVVGRPVRHGTGAFDVLSSLGSKSEA